MPDALKVTAFLSAGIAVFDDWSPDLASLLEWLILDGRGMASPNPSAQDVEASRPVVDQHMPLTKGIVGAEWYWQTSSPCYTYRNESISKFRKRWAPGIDSPSPNWGKRKAKWDTSQGAEKAYDLPLFVRIPPTITWYCNGDRDEIESLLQGCTGLGKKRAHGYGQVNRWEVEEIGNDWHLFGPNGELMRPIPIAALPTDRSVGFAIRDWGWRPPAWLSDNKTRCAMPIHTTYLDTASLAGAGR